MDIFIPLGKNIKQPSMTACSAHAEYLAVFIHLFQMDMIHWPQTVGTHFLTLLFHRASSISGDTKSTYHIVYSNINKTNSAKQRTRLRLCHSFEDILVLEQSSRLFYIKKHPVVPRVCRPTLPGLYRPTLIKRLFVYRRTQQAPTRESDLRTLWLAAGGDPYHFPFENELLVRNLFTAVAAVASKTVWPK